MTKAAHPLGSAGISRQNNRAAEFSKLAAPALSLRQGEEGRENTKQTKNRAGFAGFQRACFSGGAYRRDDLHAGSLRTRLYFSFVSCFLGSFFQKRYGVGQCARYGG